MKITGIEDKKKIEGDDREFLMEFDQLLGLKSEVLSRFEKRYKDQIKKEPVIRIFGNILIPLAYLVLGEAHRLILEKIAEERIKEKVL